MEKAEIKEIAVYLKELDEGLVEFDYRGLTNLSDLNRLYEIIPRLFCHCERSAAIF